MHSDQGSQFSNYDWEEFDSIEMFYNPKRRHGYNNRLSPIDYEKQYFKRLA